MYVRVKCIWFQGHNKTKGHLRRLREICGCPKVVDIDMP